MPCIDATCDDELFRSLHVICITVFLRPVRDEAAAATGVAPVYRYVPVVTVYDNVVDGVISESSGVTDA